MCTYECTAGFLLYQGLEAQVVLCGVRAQSTPGTLRAVLSVLAPGLMPRVGVSSCHGGVPGTQSAPGPGAYWPVH